MKRLFRHWKFVLGIAAACVATQDPGKAATPVEQHQALLKELQSSTAAYFQTTNAAERNAIVARVVTATVKLLELVEKQPKEPFALSALTQIISQEYWLNTHTSHPGWGRESPQARAIGLMLRDHLESDQLVEACKRVNFSFRQECETFLRAVLAKNPHREVRGAACLRLAQFLAGRMERLDLLKEQPELARRYESLFGTEYIEALRRQDRASVMKEAEAIYDRANMEFGDVKLPYNETVGDAARTDLFEIRYLCVGKTAPDIDGPDQEGQPFKLSDYRGKIVLLYFWAEY
jgi:hypothetical protein